ncbi:MAG: YitT family protein [Firmicutes bacterium]|nr:YitT family protein [Bacillota bacterium]
MIKNKKIKAITIKYLMIIVGSALFAAGFQFFLYPNSIIVGGVSGIAMIINLLTKLPVGLLTIVLNIPLFIIAWRYFGTDFIVGSLVGMLLSSVFVDLFALLSISPTNDMLLACIIGGAVKGLGLGIVYYAGATTGGTDIIAKFIRLKFPYLNFGTVVLITDCFIIVAFAAIFNKVESAMYAVITMFVVSKVVDLVLYGIDNSSVCYIISEKSDQLVTDITDRLHRGVTILEGEGAYSHKNKQVLLCVVKRTQIADIRKMIKSIDENAFFIITDAKNVFGKGFGDIADFK